MFFRKDRFIELVIPEGTTYVIPHTAAIQKNMTL